MEQRRIGRKKDGREEDRKGTLLYLNMAYVEVCNMPTPPYKFRPNCPLHRDWVIDDVECGKKSASSP